MAEAAPPDPSRSTPEEIRTGLASSGAAASKPSSEPTRRDPRANFYWQQAGARR